MNATSRLMPRRRYRWAAAGAGMILMPLASHAANHVGWHAMVQAPNDGDHAMAALAGPSFYADTWTNGTRSPRTDADVTAISIAVPRQDGVASDWSERHGLTRH